MAIKYNFTEENIAKIKKWMDYLSKGSYGNSKDITDTYNEVFQGVRTKANYTSCGACLRSRINSMYSALREWEKVQEEEQKKVEPLSIPTAGTTETHIAVVEGEETLPLTAEEYYNKHPKKKKKDGKN